MKRSPCLLLALGVLLFRAFMPPIDAHALDSIHDVYVQGNALPGPVTAPAPPSPNCVSLATGSTGQGTNYGDLVLRSTDNVNAAQILAIENNNNCYGITPDSVRDQLVLYNTNVIPTGTGTNKNLTIEYRADFDSGPDGAVVFGGFMKGTFKKKDSTGAYNAVTCSGSVPPNGPCSITYAPAVYSQSTQLEYPLTPTSSTNPFGGKFSITTPTGSAIPMGTALPRTFHGIVTIVLPSTDHMVELTGGAILEKGRPE